MKISHLFDDTIADVNVDNLTAANVVEISAKLGVSTANHQEAICWFYVLVEDPTQLAILSIPGKKIVTIYYRY